MRVPSVLCLSGLDPTGGAGLQADIETCAANATHALGLVTALTVQDTFDVAEVEAVSPDVLSRQLDRLLSDVQPASVKIGLIGSAAQLPTIAALLRRLALPTVCDPILRAGGGMALPADALREAVLTTLLPCVTVLTPNAAEARRLVPAAGDLAGVARGLFERGLRHLLITGGDVAGEMVVNHWYADGQLAQSWRWTRLAGPFHGAGCTLSAALAARLARGEAMAQALQRAQTYTQTALEQALAVGGGRPVPGRAPREDLGCHP